MEKILDEIDAKLPNESTDYSIKSAKFSFLYIKSLFDGIQENIHLLKEILAQERPEKIISFKCNHSQPQGLLPFSADESVFAQLLDLDGWNVPVFCFSATTTIPLNASHPGKANGFKHFLARHSTLFNMAMIAKRKGMRYLIPVALSYLRSRKIPVVVYGGGYNWDDGLVELYCAGFHQILRYSHVPDDINPVENTKEIQIAIEKICKENMVINNNAIMYGIDTRPLFFKKLSIILARTFQESITAYQQFSVFLNKRNPKCLLLSIQAYHIDRAIIKSAHDYGIHVISWQHGGSGYFFHPIMAFAEFIDSDVHLVFGTAVKESYIDTSQRLKISQPPKFIPVGSSSLDNIAWTYHQKSPYKKNFSILYITTLYIGISSYISVRSNQSSYNETLWKVQKSIFECAKKNPSLEFVVKLHSTQKKDDHIFQYASDLGIQNITFIIDEKTIPQLVKDADMIIFDVISTGLLQVIHSKKPIFTFSALANQYPYTLNLLKKRAFVFDNIDSLMQGIEEFLDPDSSGFAERYGVDYNNTDFLTEYGTFKNDGKSALRAVHIVKEIVISDEPSLP